MYFVNFKLPGTTDTNVATFQDFRTLSAFQNLLEGAGYSVDVEVNDEWEDCISEVESEEEEPVIHRVVVELSNDYSRTIFDTNINPDAMSSDDWNTLCQQIRDAWNVTTPDWIVLRIFKTDGQQLGRINNTKLCITTPRIRTVI